MILDGLSTAKVLKMIIRRLVHLGVAIPVIHHFIR